MNKKQTPFSQTSLLAEGAKIIEGMIERVLFSAEEKGYLVAKFRCPADDRLITIVGNFFGPYLNERLRLTGGWVRHPKYGEQFRVDRFEVLLPSGKEEVFKYLAMGNISGIGPEMAERLVKAFGDQVFRVLDEEPHRLSEVRGIRKKKAAQILEDWKSQRDAHRVMVFLAKHDIGGATAAKIYARYGENAIAVLQTNPYQLAIEIDGIGFLTADLIARKLGLALDAPARLQAGLLHASTEATNGRGHCYLPDSVLLAETEKILRLGKPEMLREALESTLKENRLMTVSDASAAESGESQRLIYLPWMHIIEKGVARQLQALCSWGATETIPHQEKALQSIEQKMGIHFIGGQREAVIQSLTTKISVITGGPGVGKTTIIRAIVALWQKAGKTVLLAAPTGRAAKRLAEATREEAKTIHRLLGYNPHTNSFEQNHKNLLTVDLLVVDETSMVDIVLAYRLMDALPQSATVVFVGDADQLPSVGPGNFLSDLIASGCVPVARLTHIFRQASGSSIVHTAHQVNQGKIPEIRNNESEDIFFYEEEDPAKAAQLLLRLVTQDLPAACALDPQQQIQVLTPMYRGELGADALNQMLRQALNPKGEAIGQSQFRVGDKVMQIKNNYEKDIFNGDIGWIEAVDREQQLFWVSIDGRPVKYGFHEMADLIPAYAVSIHKAQGSEYPAVVIPLHTQHYIMLERNLLYTAITRGRTMVILIGTKQAMSVAVRTKRMRERYTRLAALLRQPSP